MSNRIVVRIRDRSAGAGGVRCDCCARCSHTRRRARAAFSGEVRIRVRRFVARDLLRDPE